MALITVNPDIVSGTPCFAGTRVPVRSLFDWLRGGHTLDDFLRNFPSVSRQHAVDVLHLAEHEAVDHAGRAQPAAHG